MRCPRRDEFGVPAFAQGTEDEWKGTRCSYCGSLNPDKFMRLLGEGVELTPTDKNYKAYTGGSGNSKFYYAHLSIPQRQEFVRRVNAREIAFGYPGNLYVLPFFMAAAVDA